MESRIEWQKSHLWIHSGNCNEQGMLFFTWPVKTTSADSSDGYSLFPRNKCFNSSYAMQCTGILTYLSSFLVLDERHRKTNFLQHSDSQSHISLSLEDKLLLTLGHAGISQTQNPDPTTSVWYIPCPTSRLWHAQVTQRGHPRPPWAKLILYVTSSSVTSSTWLLPELLPHLLGKAAAHRKTYLGW